MPQKSIQRGPAIKSFIHVALRLPVALLSLGIAEHPQPQHTRGDHQDTNQVLEWTIDFLSIFNSSCLLFHFVYFQPCKYLIFLTTDCPDRSRLLFTRNFSILGENFCYWCLILGRFHGVGGTISVYCCWCSTFCECGCCS